MLKAILNKYNFDTGADRLGPDIPFTHWKLYFKSKMVNLCKEKFLNFGDNSEFRAGAYADACSKIHIGSNVVIRPGSFIFAEPSGEKGRIIIEDNVLIGSGVHIYASNHAFEDSSTDIFYQGQQEGRCVFLRKGCWIGANAIILPGVTIGKNSVVGAGSVVTKDVPDFSVAVGNPARVIKATNSQCDKNE
ncbi:acyltransferase [Stutzerimonas nitrititolerans]|uniref:acyltransferase n=1 Tax=Stutzerimonas nitrititolerans TaxID=2482751 RepID=UPI0028A96925|nr:acyltransferase [Stutzerimonas nitrititolerans]